MKYEIGGFPD